MQASDFKLKLIRNSGLFDADWYSENNPDVELSGLDPAEHYLLFGGKLGRDPSPRFNAAVYLSRNEAVTEAGDNPLLHFVSTRESRHSSDSLLQSTPQPPTFMLDQQFPYRPHLQGLVNRFRTRIAAERNGKDYEQIEKIIDLPFYLQRYADLVRANINPVAHYVAHGRRERRQLWPHFNPRNYVARNPDIAKDSRDVHIHYLEEGRSQLRANNDYEIGSDAFTQYCEAFGYDQMTLDQARCEKQIALRESLERGKLGEMVSKAAQIEPLIAHGWLASLTPGLSPLRSETTLRFMSAMKRMHAEAEFRPAKAVVLIPWCHVSGATRVAGFLADALARIHDPRDIVIIRTETSEMDFPEWFPEGVRHIDFAAHAGQLKDDIRNRLLVSILRSLKVEHIFNVNSRTFWEALSAYGTPLSQKASIYSYLFCSEVDNYGNVGGYPVRRFLPTFESHTRFFLDSDYLLDQLTQRFRLPPSQRQRLLKLATPLSGSPEQAPTPVETPSRARQVFWASRFDRQKRVDVVYAIARSMPDVMFRMWGKPVLDRSIAALDVPKNVQHEGTYQNFTDLPLHECDAWLYTAEWDGVPNILLDVAAAGIPLVGSLAGGTSEVLRDGVSAPVADVANAQDYVDALRNIFADPTAARGKSAELRRQILEERTTEAYTDHVCAAMENPIA